MSDTKTPKFKVGQIVVIKGRKHLPFRILAVIENDGDFYYKWNRNNAAAEHMIRELTSAEKGVVAASSAGSATTL